MSVIVVDALAVSCYGLGHNKVEAVTMQMMMHRMCRATSSLPLRGGRFNATSRVSHSQRKSKILKMGYHTFMWLGIKIHMI